MPHPITLTSPLPAADLRFESMTASSGLSMLGEMQLGLVSPKPDLKPEDLLGKPVTIEVDLRNDTKRHFHGYVTSFGIGAHRGRYHGYQAVVRPWLWFLTRTSDCRIFQEQSVPDIVKKVFEDHGIANFEFKLFRSYRKWTYCVQYRESDYNFVARLLEHEGIYWYFKHGEGDHKLMLVDSQSAHDAAEGYDSLPYFENIAEAPPDTEYINQWRFSRDVKTGQVMTTSYDFERPAASLKVDKTKHRKYELSDYERFDFQGDYTQAADGAHWVDNRIDELQSRFELVRGSSNAEGLACGCLLKMQRHPREDQNAEYLITGESVHAHQSTDEAGSAAHSFQCDFSAIPSSQQFRSPRRTPKPFVQGPQTAVVVGPAGDEIYTDKYGRVKVQFHWDRYGKKDEKSSCWVRVSSPWAGKSFGFIQVPRIGQEVVVDFLEGDPDQPLITGRVYNAEQMPPWDLPANATQSGVLTRSSKGGAYSNANAIRFEDKTGAEQLWFHAEKDQLTEVENDEDKWVGRDRRKTIDRDETNHIKQDRTETVDRNEKINVHGWRTEEVDQDETITIHQNRKERVDLNESISIGVNRSETVGANETIQIGANRSVTIGGNKTETIAQAKAETIALAKALSIGLGYQTSVGAAMNTTVGGLQTEQVGIYKRVDVLGGNFTTNVPSGSILSSSGKTIELTAADEIKLTVGKSVLTMKSDGTVTLNGKDINIGADATCTITGDKIQNN
jgi:type VI secretion system secreted protein VgrG